MFWFMEPTVPPLQYPHPVITEVLYAVPTSEGDANRDGKRDSAGDEFVELVNPHNRPINLRGYTITDSGEGKARFRFTFPAVILEPGQVVVVFNGSDAKLTGPVGDAKLAPTEGHPKFHNALVFNAKTPSSRASFANKSDYALLLAPGGTPLECVHWGGEKKPPTNCLVVEEAPALTRGSIQRAMPEIQEPDPSPPATTPAHPTVKPNPKANLKSAPDRAAPDPAGRDPAQPTPAKPAKRPRYVPDREIPPAPPEPALKPLTFLEFSAHPPTPARTILRTLGAVDAKDAHSDQDDLSGILFSPGLYPLPAPARESERVDAGSGDPAPRAQTPTGPDRNNPQDPPRTNTGDPR
ncbi:MAG TPA: lamin tail domain-containing protein [Phycisphaerales bacterium]|nr:lamin tail domain-containing protein [Phycisphaerales bacterium]